MIELSLWGPRELEFDGDTVYEVGQNNHVIAIFVGTSMKQYKGSPPFLSGQLRVDGTSMKMMSLKSEISTKGIILIRKPLI
jgi:hypothetical protein